MAKNQNNNYYYQNVSQDKFQNDQDVLNIDFNQLFDSFIAPVDAVRSHFNALIPNSQELNTPQYQESRCHAFYRMMGFPIVSDVNNFYSPGFDPNLNTDPASLASYQKIATTVSNTLSLTSQFSNREGVPILYRRVFSASGTNAQALAVGSIFIRAFDKQFGNTDPLTDDPNRSQIINDRNTEIQRIFGNSVSTTLLISQHPLKPFIVDPRIDLTVRPVRNRICAPFLKDKSQTKIFQSQNGSSDNLKRPYIEKVISTRFNNSNITLNPGQNVLNDIVNNILSNKNITNQDLINTSSNSLAQLTSEIVIFNNYIKIIQIVVETLVSSMKEIQYARQKINWKPIPDPKGGPEAGGTLNPVDVNDTQNNKQSENNIIILTQNKTISDLSLDVGLQGIPDPGDFAFSNLDDSIFSIEKNIQKSYDDNLNSLNSLRDQLGNQAIQSMKNIEIIMGEFSGIGLIDMIAIQAALWIMDPSALLGLIDVRAFDRMKSYRSDINTKNLTQSDVITSLTNFEMTLKNIYLYIQGYYNSINDGTAFSV